LTKVDWAFSFSVAEKPWPANEKLRLERR